MDEADAAVWLIVRPTNKNNPLLKIVCLLLLHLDVCTYIILHSEARFHTGGLFFIC